MKHAVAYFRTSSAANVGADKDSEARQRLAVSNFAARNDYEIVDEFYDAAVSGGDPVDKRPGFAALLKRIAGNGVRTILVETANRFARDLMVQETGWRKLKDLDVELIAVDSPNAFIDDTPSAILIRQILGSVAEFDRALTVAKLRSGRERKIALFGKCGGQKSWAEMSPDAVAMAQVMHSRGLSLRQIAAEMDVQGFSSKTGRPIQPGTVKRMIKSVAPTKTEPAPDEAG